MAVWLTWAMRDICSGSNLRLQAHKNIWCLRNPSFHWLKIGTTMQPRHAVVWSGVAVTASSTPMCRFFNCVPPILPLRGVASPSPKPYVCTDRMSCHSSCVVMHFCRCNDSVGIFLLPKAFLGRLGPLPHTGFAKHFLQPSISPDIKNVCFLCAWRGMFIFFSIILNYIKFSFEKLAFDNQLWLRKTGQVVNKMC